MTDVQAASAHVDPFVRQRLPPSELWPHMDWSGVPELAYPPQINCASELLDRWIAEGGGERVAFHHAAGAWTYRRVFEAANRIAHVLVDDFGLVPGNRVLLRAANQPMVRPVARPAIAITPPWRITIQTMSRSVAPRAIRVPISRVRWRTAYDITP